MPQVQTRRVYEEPEPSDGTRVLVDRLWPRGLSKSAAHLGEWLKAVAPSDELRHWYGHDPAKWEEFRHRYGEELKDPARAEAFGHLRELAAARTVTLLTATKDLELSQAEYLAELLRDCQREAAGATGAAGDRGGDPVCWLPRVCPKCGTMTGAEPPTTCPRCHTRLPA
jgi:uncharacterized protein YeaO (DUF488 family)